jgi:hypothetical protein
MPRATTNKSMRLDEPQKQMRRRPLDDGETDESNRVPGASGQPASSRRRPGRAAALRTIAQRTRSQRWRSVAKGKVKRRARPAKAARGGRAQR